MRTTVILTMLLLVASASAAFGQVVPPANNNAFIPGNGPGSSIVQVSDQKAGSILVYPFYTSGTVASGDDTKITITNVGASAIAPNVVAPAPPAIGSQNGTLPNVNIHMFWMDNSCNQADAFVCLTAGGSLQFSAATWDPLVTGMVIAVAVDPQGYPISYNGLIGNAFINAAVTQGGVTERWVGNYGAEAIASLGTLVAVPGVNQNYFYTTAANPNQPATAALLQFVNGPRSSVPGYDALPNQFAADFVSPVGAGGVAGQTIVMVSMNGSIAPQINGFGQVVSLTGNAYSGLGQVTRGSDEANVSFVGPALSSCQQLTRITATNPRIPFGIGNFINAGKIGTITWSTVGGALGLVVTPLQAGVANPAGGFYGIRTVHKRNVSLLNTDLLMPLFQPVCL